MMRACVTAAVAATLAGLTAAPLAAESWSTPDEVRASLLTRTVECDVDGEVRHRVEFGPAAKSLSWERSEQVIAVETRENDETCRPGRHEAVVRVRTESGVKAVRIGYRVFRDEWRPVLAKDLPRGHEVDESDLTWQWVDVGRNADTALNFDEPLVLRRRGNAGEPLTSRLVESPPQVTRGDRVSVVVVRKGIVVRTDGIAQETGRLGERIRVKNAKSGEVFEAEIVGVKEVEL